MSLLRSVLGTITQSMGGITATTWKGKNVLKQKVAANNTSNTPAQATQRRKFGKLAKLGGGLGPVVRIGLRVAAADVTEQNIFYTLNKDSVTDNGTVASINYSLVKVSTGNVGGVSGLTAAYDAVTGSLVIQVLDNSNGADALPTDLVSYAVIDTVTGIVYTSPNHTTREDLLGYAPIMPAGRVPASFQVYAFFKRAANTSTSPSTTRAATV